MLFQTQKKRFSLFSAQQTYKQKLLASFEEESMPFFYQKDTSLDSSKNTFQSFSEKSKSYINGIPFKQWFYQGFMLIFGCVLCALTLHAFYLPNKMIMGGVSGIAGIIYQVTNLNIPFGTLTILLNIPILLLGYYTINRAFVIKSLTGAFLYGFVIDILEPYFSPLAPYLFPDPLAYDNLILSSIAGSAIYGLGLGLIFYSGFTSGGSDVIAMVIRRYSKRFSVGQLLAVIDGIIIIVAGILYEAQKHGQFRIAVYSTIAMFITSASTDFILEGFNFKRVAFIISTKSEEIATDIMTKMDRGCTGVYTRGMYSKEDRLMLVCAVRSNQIRNLRRIAEDIDPKVFIFIFDSREVAGEGFVSNLTSN